MLSTSGMTPQGDDTLFSALTAASLESDEKSVALLAQWQRDGTRIDGVRNGLGNTALHQVVRQGHVKAVEWLLKNGACADVENLQGQSPREIAKIYKGYGHDYQQIVEAMDRYPVVPPQDSDVEGGEHVLGGGVQTSADCGGFEEASAYAAQIAASEGDGECVDSPPVRALRDRSKVRRQELSFAEAQLFEEDLQAALRQSLRDMKAQEAARTGVKRGWPQGRNGGESTAPVKRAFYGKRPHHGAKRDHGMEANGYNDDADAHDGGNSFDSDSASEEEEGEPEEEAVKGPRPRRKENHGPWPPQERFGTYQLTAVQPQGDPIRRSYNGPEYKPIRIKVRMDSVRDDDDARCKVHLRQKAELLAHMNDGLNALQKMKTLMASARDKKVPRLQRKSMLIGESNASTVHATSPGKRNTKTKLQLNDLRGAQPALVPMQKESAAGGLSPSQPSPRPVGRPQLVETLPMAHPGMRHVYPAQRQELLRREQEQQMEQLRLAHQRQAEELYRSQQVAIQLQREQQQQGLLHMQQHNVQETLARQQHAGQMQVQAHLMGRHHGQVTSMQMQQMQEIQRIHQIQQIQQVMAMAAQTSLVQETQKRCPHHVTAVMEWLRESRGAKPRDMPSAPHVFAALWIWSHHKSTGESAPEDVGTKGSSIAQGSAAPGTGTKVGPGALVGAGLPSLAERVPNE